MRKKQVSITLYKDMDVIFCESCNQSFILMVIWTTEDVYEEKTHELLGQISCYFCPYCGVKPNKE